VSAALQTSAPNSTGAGQRARPSDPSVATGLRDAAGVGRIAPMRPVPGEVLHFSEDPAIAVFRPHVAATARQPRPYVWAVDAMHAPSYWFPRDCPRAMAWAGPTTTPADRARIFGATSAVRVHVIEYAWLNAMSRTTLYAYRFDAAQFHQRDVAWVSEDEVRPLGPAEPVGDLLAAHAGADIELRVVNDLRPWWSAVVGSTVEFSGIRLRNAAHPM
jgi:uncharacterized protein DUF6886